MVERITDPHRPVVVHGTGRIPDGQGVPQPPAAPPPPVTFTERVWAVVFVGVVLAAIALGSVLS